MDKLRDCQKEALLHFEKYYYIDEETRGIISMCCGSGKTRTVYEMIKLSYQKYDNTFFILVTSRKHLIYQIGKDMMKWCGKDKLPFLVKFVGGSGEQYPKKTLKNSKDIRRDILNTLRYGTHKPLIIITTYHSSHHFLEAINGEDKMSPELLICDEAHNTTGENKDFFQTLIRKDNELFNAQKYVFMTATPVQLILKNKNAPFTNKETVYSMCNQSIYGDIIYEYSFRDGIRDAIICDFKTIYYEKNYEKQMSEELIEEIKNKSKEEKQKIYFLTISKFLLNAITTYNLKHILVYCSSHLKVKMMMNELKKINNEKNLDYDIRSILSDDTKTKRKKDFISFEKNDDNIHILFTVSILDEGVDVKCTDAVFFSEERITESRIVQNVGRCLRTDPDNNPDKKCGYVIIPNIVQITNIDTDNYDEDTSTTLKTYSKNFVKIREVLEKMKEQSSLRYWGKYVKGYENDGNFENEEKLNDLYEKNDIIIKTQDEDQDKRIINEDNEENDIELSEFYVQESTYGSIANVSLNKLKKLKPENVKTINEWIKHTRNKKISYIYLHKEFKSDWICWGDFLINETLEYDEAKNIIKKYFNKKFKNPEEWFDYYKYLIYREIIGMREQQVTDEMINDIIKIPNKPKEYYKGEWKDWNDFLGNCEQIVGYQKVSKGNGTENSDKNIKDLIDNKNRNDTWYTYNMNDKLLESLKKYIVKQIGIVNDVMYIELRTRICNKKNGSFDKCCIMCIVKNGDFTNSPILIWPEESKIVYDEKIFMNRMTNNNKLITQKENEKYKRNKYHYIQDKILLNDLNIMINDIKKSYKQKKYSNTDKNTDKNIDHDNDNDENDENDDSIKKCNNGKIIINAKRSNIKNKGNKRKVVIKNLF